MGGLQDLIAVQARQAVTILGAIMTDKSTPRKEQTAIAQYLLSTALRYGTTEVQPITVIDDIMGVEYEFPSGISRPWSADEEEEEGGDY